MIFDVDECEQIIGYKFKDKSLLRQCFTFKSYANENKSSKDNERLEFLGDAVLQLVITDYLYKNYRCDEGDMTEMRKNYVSKIPLMNAIKEMRLDRHMILGSGAYGELKGTEKNISSLFESIVAGIYLDGGMEKAKKFILDNLDVDNMPKQCPVKEKNKKQENKILTKNIKNILQEYVQQGGTGKVEYLSISKSGMDNQPTFVEACIVNGKEMSRGSGGSKKLAQMQAAEKAYEILTKKANKRVKN